MESSSSSISSSNFVESNFFSGTNDITEYIELPCKSNFNRLYKIKRFGQWFVLKSLKPEFLSQAMYVSLLKKEFDVAVQMDHPYIVKTILKEENKRVGPAIMMEYVDGMTLNEFLKTSPSKKTRMRIVSQILDAMKYFHSKQIVHRDLKPSNILITHNGFNVKIIDFGLADADSYDIFKQPAGTKKYAAPEQMTMGGNVDNRTDIYAFGKILNAVFPHRYKFIVRKCTFSDKSKRFSNVEKIIKAFSYIKKCKILIFCLLIVVMLIVQSILLIDSYNKVNSLKVNSLERVESPNQYTNREQIIINDSFRRIDSIYKPIYLKIDEGKCYREFIQLEILDTYDDVNKIRKVYEKDIEKNSLFATQFSASYHFKWGAILQDLDEKIKNLSSFIEDYNNGKIDFETYNKLYSKYNELISHIKK